tara:strand:+ start:1908 stop:4241 length:2334 start_codon:yes stop_codon:yes gene_type:complete
MLHKYHFLKVIILIFILLPLKNSYSKDYIVKDAIDPYCNGSVSDVSIKEKKIKNIEIVLNNPRRWIENAFRVLVDFNSEDSKTHNKDWFNFRIDDKYKKNFDSHVVVNFTDDNLSCKFKAKVRITGDLWWHLDWKGGTPLTSLYVRLLDGHINNITRFKLFLPKAREGGENEVFISSFLRELGFLAPRTFMISSRINGTTQKYIFQEDLRKEFLENFNLVEGPLLEGDERFTVDRIKDDKMIPGLSLSRIINKNFSLKDEINGRTALSAVSALNLIYLQSHQSKSLIEEYYMPYDRLHIDTENFFLDESNKKKFQTYEALIYALDAYHGQSYDDRRFYFDPINQNFLPIYYDGKSNIVNNKQKSELQKLSKKISIDAKKGSIKAIKLIKAIDHKKHQKRLKDLGVNFSSNDYGKIIDRITNRLEAINTSEPELVEFSKSKKYFSGIKNEETKNIKLIFVNFDKKEFYICDFDLKECDTKKNTIVEFQNLLAEALSQRFSKIPELKSKNNEYLFVYDDINYEKGKYPKQKIWKSKKIDDQFVVKYNEQIELNVFNDKKEINIKQKSNSGRVIITGNKIDSWNIIFNGNKFQNDTNISSNNLSLTGCVTLLDIEVSNINLFSKSSACEDSINFIRTKGNVNEVKIIDSESDAFDLDFSNLKINSIEIDTARNDCLDFSYGIYEVNNIEAKNCGDKGISIGEKSNITLKEIEIKKSNIALAAKDSSFVKIYKSKIFESPICFSAYRKKQEFSGAKIEILETNCDKEMFFTQKGSQIILDL